MCSCYLFLAIGCTARQHNSTRLANELPNDQQSYYLQAYGTTQKDEYLYGYTAIKIGVTFNNDIQGAAVGESISTASELVSDMKLTKELLSKLLMYYYHMWSTSIDNHTRHEYRSVDFNEAFKIIHNEFSRIGIYQDLDKMQDRYKSLVSKLDSSKYQKTLDLYGILSEMISLAKSPKGSLLSYGKKVDDLRVDFDRVASMAEIEVESK